MGECSVYLFEYSNSESNNDRLVESSQPFEFSAVLEIDELFEKKCKLLE